MLKRKTPLKPSGGLNKTGKGLSKGKGLKKVSEAGKAKRIEKNDRNQLMIECFRRVGAARILYDGPYYYWLCEETGQKIYHLSPMNMHHCLYKGIDQYKIYIASDWNIMIVRPEVHNQTHIDIDKTPKIKERTEYLKQMHTEGKLIP